MIRKIYKTNHRSIINITFTIAILLYACPIPLVSNLLSLSSIVCYAGAFEDIGIGARGRGMGNAFSAIADDSSAIYWNPAALGNNRRKEVMFFYQDLYGLGLINYNFIGYVHPNIGKGTVGFGWTRLGTTDSVNFMDYSENTFIFSYGSELIKNLSLGINLKYFSVLYDIKASGIGFDLASMYLIPDYDLRFALVWYNINNPQIRWESSAVDDLKSIIRLGIGYEVTRNHLVSLETNKKIDEKAHFSLGWESWFLRKKIAVRTGLSEQDDHVNLALGFSYTYRRLRLDYTLERHYTLGYSSIFNISVGI